MGQSFTNRDYNTLNNNVNNFDSDIYPVNIYKNKIIKKDYNTFYYSYKSKLTIPIVFIIQGVAGPIIWYFLNGLLPILAWAFFGIIDLIGIICLFTMTLGIYLILEGNLITKRSKTLCCKKEEKIFIPGEFERAELIFKDVSDDEGTSYSYSIYLIKKSGEKKFIFNIRESIKIDNLEGLNYIVNCLNNFIQNNK